MSVGFRQSSWIALVLASAAGSLALADPPILGTPQVEPAPDKDGNARRRVYVLHSGIHTILANKNKNIFAENMRDSLIKRGVAERDIVVLPTPYPTARWFNMFPKQCLTWFMDSADPNSWVPQTAYARMDQALRSQNVGPNDELVWIGHSAGGQMGLTMAYLAKNLDKYGDLAKEAPAYHFDMVILLGTPVGVNLLPEEVKLRHYYSPQDRIVHLVARYGPFVLRTFGTGVGVNIFPPNLDDNDRVRIFRGVEHNNWDVESRVLDRILAETNDLCCPLWHSPVLAPGLEAGMLRLMCKTLDQNCKIAFEDPPWQK